MASMALIGTSLFQGGQGIHLRPEMNRIAQFTLRNLAQPVVVLAQDEGQTAFAQGFAIAFENGIADVFLLERQVARLGRQVSAHGQADQIVGIRHGMSFVEVVDAPDQASFDVAPGAEILHVQVAHRQHLGRLGPDRDTPSARFAPSDSKWRAERGRLPPSC